MVALVLVAACDSGHRNTSIGPTPDGPPVELVVGRSISDHLAVGEKRSYAISLASGEFVDIEVLQHTADVAVSLFDASGKSLIEVDGLTGITRPERLAWVAEESGRYRLEIAASAGSEGHYQVVLAARHPATGADRLHGSAARAFARGSELAERDDASLDAVSAYEQALALWQELDDRPRQADTLYRLGRLHYSRRDQQRSLEAFEQALGILEQVPNARQLGSVHHWLGHLYYRFEDLERARDHYVQALPLRQQVGFAAGEAQTRNNLGLILQVLGGSQQALEHYEVALPIWRRLGDRVGVARTLHNRGRCYLNLGREDEALDDFKQALEIREDLGNARSLAVTLNAIGLAHNRRGEPERAFEAYHRALELRRKSEDPRGHAVTLIDIGMTHDRLGRLDQAYRAYEQALHISRRYGYGLPEAFALHGLGQVLEGRGQAGQARERFRAALDRFEAIGDWSGQLIALRSLALAERRAGRWDQARVYLENAIAAIEQQRVTLASLTLRYSFFATKQSYYDLYVDLLMEQHRRQPEAGYAAKALSISERARARSQLEALIDSGAEIRSGVDPQLRRREQELERQIETVQGRRRWMLDEGKAKRLQESDRELRDLFRQHDRVQGQIRLTSPRYAALTQPSILSAADIQRRLVDRETLLLEFDLGPSRSYLWIVSTDQVHSFELPSEVDIEKTARQAYKLLRSSHQTAAEVQTELTLEKLSDTLLGQARGLLTDQRLLVVSEGALQYIPFSTLPVPGATSGEKPELLGDRHEIVNIPSASMLATMRDQLDGRSSPEGLIAVVADPVFEADDPRVLSLSRSRGSSPRSGTRSLPKPVSKTLPRLVFSELEADRILAWAPPGKSYRATGFDADRATVTSGRLSAYRYLHFATHGELDAEYPQLSRLVLSRVDPNGQRREDDSLYAHEIYELDLPAELVVLSACETALGTEIRGEGLLGLTQGFFYAGAARVLVSLWKVDDEATAELMARFYRSLLSEGQRPATALRAAQMSIRQEPRWRAPYYWSGFMLLGEWR